MTLAHHLRILALDGGGIRGLFQAGFLTSLEREGLNVANSVQLIAGTSTGAIVGAALAIGKPAAEIAELYKTLGEKVFQCRRWLLSRWILGKSSYRSDRLRDALHGYFDPLTTLENCKCQLLVPAICLQNFRPTIFNSSIPAHKGLRLVDVLLASTAAPTYFQPHHIEDTGADYIDGGIACNNPALEAVKEGIEMGFATTDISLLSVGTGERPATNDPSRFRRRGPLGWAMPTLDAAMTANSAIIDEHCRRLLPVNQYVRVDLAMGEDIALDDHRLARRVLPAFAVDLAHRLRRQLDRWLQAGASATPVPLPDCAAAVAEPDPRS